MNNNLNLSKYIQTKYYNIVEKIITKEENEILKQKIKTTFDIAGNYEKYENEYFYTLCRFYAFGIKIAEKIAIQKITELINNDIENIKINQN